jgi:hypothetical protein
MTRPEILYRNGLAMLRHVREAPPFMEYDERSAAFVAPGYRLAELRAWGRERGIMESDAAPTEAAVPFFDPRMPLRLLTPGERVSMVWQLTLQTWAFKEDLASEPRLRRDVVRVIRRRS